LRHDALTRQERLGVATRMDHPRRGIARFKSDRQLGRQFQRKSHSISGETIVHRRKKKKRKNNNNPLDIRANARKSMAIYVGTFIEYKARTRKCHSCCNSPSNVRMRYYVREKEREREREREISLSLSLSFCFSSHVHPRRLFVSDVVANAEKPYRLQIVEIKSRSAYSSDA